VFLAAAACAFLMACGGSEEIVIDACAEVQDQTYYSIEQYECGQTPDGVAMCNWTISFADGEFNWAFSDIASTGSYSCDGAVLTAMSTGTEYLGFLDETGILTFNEIEYQAGE
jgi:hypothetical protein